MKSKSQQAIETAKRFLSQGDAATAAHVLRDLPEIAENGLSDLAWAMCSPNGYPSKGDVEFLIQELQGAV